MPCIFCQIIKKEIPSEIVFENKKFIAFKDINPKADFHILIVPKEHIESLNHLKKNQKDLMGELLFLVQKIAKKKKMKGYKLIINVGKKGGQLIDHLHLHFLSGKKIELP
jgi:histidine triad (HIT) family protein